MRTLILLALLGLAVSGPLSRLRSDAPRVEEEALLDIDEEADPFVLTDEDHPSGHLLTILHRAASAVEKGTTALLEEEEESESESGSESVQSFDPSIDEAVAEAQQVEQEDDEEEDVDDAGSIADAVQAARSLGSSSTSDLEATAEAAHMAAAVRSADSAPALRYHHLHHLAGEDSAESEMESEEIQDEPAAATAEPAAAADGPAPVTAAAPPPPPEDPAAQMGPNGPLDADAIPKDDEAPAGMANENEPGAPGPAVTAAHKSAPAEAEKSEENAEEKAEEEGEQAGAGEGEAKKENEEKKEGEEKKEEALAGAAPGGKKEDAGEGMTVSQQEASAPWAVREQLTELRDQNAKLKQLLNRAVISEHRLAEIVRADEGRTVKGFGNVFGKEELKPKDVFAVKQQGVTASISVENDDEDDDEEKDLALDIQTESTEAYDNLLPTVN